MKKKLPRTLAFILDSAFRLLCSALLLVTHHSSLPAGSKLRQCHILGYVIENYFYRHTHCNVGVVYFYEIGQQPRPFVQLDLSHVVRDFVLYRGKISLVEHDPGIDFSPATQLLPGEVARPTVGTKWPWGMP